MKRLLVATRDEREIWGALLSDLLPVHDVVVWSPSAGPEVVANIAYVAVGQPPPGLIAALAGLELVLSVNAGIEPLLAPGAVPDGVPIVRMVDPGLTEGMIEWVLAQTLAWRRNLFEYAASQQAGAWAPRPEILARETTVTVLGAGAIGGPVAEALAALRFRTRIWSRSPRVVVGAQAFAGAAGFAAALDGADVLVNILPQTAATEGLLDAEAFGRLARGALVINAGRGSAVVEEDLLAALDEGVLGGAVLDVFRAEPLAPDHPFWRHPRVRVSPHVAAVTHPRTAAAVLAETVRRWERGEPLDALVDRARGY